MRCRFRGQYRLTKDPIWYQPKYSQSLVLTNLHTRYRMLGRKELPSSNSPSILVFSAMSVERLECECGLGACESSQGLVSK
jgi:hypothetical protein